MIAIFKFDFLDIVPIATKTVLNRISDGFLVIDKNMRIIDYNKTALDLFGRVSILKRKDSLFKVLSTFESVNPNILEKSLKKIETTWKPVIFEHHFKEKSFNKYFNIEITPIISKENILGNIILLRDISGYKEQLKIIKKQQEQIIERECLASLGTLMGGISHNLKTPIMSISGCIIALEDLISEYDESIDNPIVSSDDHHEIAAEMKKRMGDLNGHLTYISNALTAMKNQVANPANRKDMKFTVEEVVLNVDFLMKYEIKSNLCTLITRVEASPDKKVKGDIGTFVQIINNLITNSIQSYEKINDDNRINALSRKIELSIYETGGSIVFKVQDFGKGISGAIKEKLFKEMVTTKGKEGTGIGLFLSSAKVKGSFNGDMWFESQENKGTTFYIKVPSLDISKE
ncbi:MAG: ATP-binding protein [Bacillota bacterium]|nr:ATP-binding protein [Bacillota bacterium]